MYRLLPEAWADQPAWTVLDTDFRDGQHFRNAWLAWQRDPQRPKLLHYVAMAQALPLGFGAHAEHCWTLIFKPRTLDDYPIWYGNTTVAKERRIEDR